MESIAKVIAEYGPAVGLLALCAGGLVSYAWRDWNRIQALEDRVEKLEVEVRVKLTAMLTNMEQALRESTEQVRLSKKIIEEFLLRDR